MILDRYTVLASVYDFFFDEEYTDRVYQSQRDEIDRLISRSRDEGLDILEVGCGTGRMTLKLTELGDVTAIDDSSDMLSILEMKIRNKKNKPMLIQVDFLSSEYTKSFDLVIMCLDVLNYFPQSDISKVMEKAYSLLREGGVFAFDFSSEYKLRNELGNNTIAQDFDDFAFIWENSLNEHLSCVNFDFALFEKQEDGLYKKQVERHRQCIHDISTVLDEGLKYFDEYSVYKDFISEHYELDRIHVRGEGDPDRYYVYFKKGK